jgi:hypothetical protein
VFLRKPIEVVPAGDIPDVISKLIQELKELFIHGIQVAEVLSGTQQLMPNDVALVQTYAIGMGNNSMVSFFIEKVGTNARDGTTRSLCLLKFNCSLSDG